MITCLICYCLIIFVVVVVVLKSRFAKTNKQIVIRVIVNAFIKLLTNICDFKSSL